MKKRERDRKRPGSETRREATGGKASGREPAPCRRPARPDRSTQARRGSAGTGPRKSPPMREGRFLNLKGDTSSYALLRCLLLMEELPHGGVLEVLVSDEQVSSDLARFLTEEGHRVTEIERTRPSVWRLDIEKGRK